MLLADTVATGVSNFHGFDIFMILFTVLIVIAFIRAVTAKNKNLFALGFVTVCLLTFLALDTIMVLGWLGIHL